MKHKNPMMTIRRLVGKRGLLSVSPSDLIRKAACLMPLHHTSAAAVIDDHGRFAGILTERDIVQKAISVYRNVDETTVGQIMTPHPVTIPVDSSISYALSVMTGKGFRYLPVMEGERVVGILDIRDLYEEVQDMFRKTIQKNELMLSYAFGEPYCSASISRNMQTGAGSA